MFIIGCDDDNTLIVLIEFNLVLIQLLKNALRLLSDYFKY